MTLAVPTNLIDTVGTATASGVEAAGHLLQEVSHAVSAAAATTSGRARRMVRSTQQGRSRSTTARTLTVLGVIGAVALIAVMVRRMMFDGRISGVSTADGGNPPPSPATKPERNGTMASAQPDEIKGRIKEAAGALTDNKDLKREGKTDRAAANVKDGLDKVRDKIEDGVDAVKDRLNKD